MNNKEAIICGIQQVGIGVEDVVKAYNWYIGALGCDIKVVDDDGVAAKMLPYTGGKPRPRRAVIAENLRGGGGYEIWQPKDGNITPPSKRACLGDLGVDICKVKTADPERAFVHFKETPGAEILTEVSTAPYGKKHFYISDPWKNIFEIVEDGFVFADLKKLTVGGVDGAVIGVTDMERSMNFYSKVYGFDKVLFDGEGVYDDFKGVPGGEGRFRRVLLTRSEPFKGPISRLYGTAHIELVQALDRTPVKIFEGRLWGDPGFIQLCFDVRNMDALRPLLQQEGKDFVCDSGEGDFKMDAADGRFTYAEDPDGTLIEMVETYRIPLSQKWGLYLNLKGKDPERALPSFLIKGLKFMRVKGI